MAGNTAIGLWGPHVDAVNPAVPDAGSWWVVICVSLSRRAGRPARGARTWGAPMEPRDTVTAIADTWLVGDRYAISANRRVADY